MTENTDIYNLDRFVRAQQSEYEIALKEIKNGKKRSHWMWFIFPQLKGLGFSETSRYYGIKDLKEAEAYLQHPVLGHRLIQISQTLISQEDRSAAEIFGYPDDLKLHSSMTLFAVVPNADPIFQNVLDQFFKSKQDQKTLRTLGL